MTHLAPNNLTALMFLVVLMFLFYNVLLWWFHTPSYQKKYPTIVSGTPKSKKNKKLLNRTINMLKTNKLGLQSVEKLFSTMNKAPLKVKGTPDKLKTVAPKKSTSKTTKSKKKS